MLCHILIFSQIKKRGVPRATRAANQTLGPAMSSITALAPSGARRLGGKGRLVPRNSFADTCIVVLSRFSSLLQLVVILLWQPPVGREGSFFFHFLYTCMTYICMYHLKKKKNK
jgi:hypothetical protein